MKVCLTLIILAALTWVLALSVTTARAQMMFSAAYPQQTGEALYQGICQGCHMPDAKGAVGAGAYPALAGNPRLVTAIYPVIVVTNGQRAMPSFGGDLSDMQIANVINYVRTHFGNHYKDLVTPAFVKAARLDPEPGPIKEH